MAVKVLLFLKNSFQSFSVGFYSHFYKDVLILGMRREISALEMRFSLHRHSMPLGCSSRKSLEFGM